MCCLCQEHVCRNVKCADWLPKVAQWQCQRCRRSRTSSASSAASLVQTSSWVADQMSLQQDRSLPNRARSEIFIAINDPSDPNSMRKFLQMMAHNTSGISLPPILINSCAQLFIDVNYSRNNVTCRRCMQFKEGESYTELRKTHWIKII